LVAEGIGDAIRLVHRRFGALQAALEGNELVFRPDLDARISFDHGRNTFVELAALAEEELVKGFGAPHAEENQLLWRAFVSRNAWVLLVLHHVIADGASRTLLMEAILQALSHSLPEATPTSLHPSIDQVAERVSFHARGQLHSQVQCGADQERRAWSVQRAWPSPEGLASTAERRTHFCVARLECSSQLRSACRSHGVTVTAALCAAVALVLFNKLGLEGASAARLVPCASVDIRSLLPELQGAFGSYSFGGKWPCSLFIDQSSTFWDIAAQALQGLREHATAERVFDTQRFHTYANALQARRIPQDGVDRPNTYWDKLDGEMQGRDSSFNVSNLGALPQLQQREFCVSETYAVSSQTSSGNYLFLSASSVQNRLCLSLGAVEPIVSRPSLAALMESLTQILERHASTAD